MNFAARITTASRITGDATARMTAETARMRRTAVSRPVSFVCITVDWRYSVCTWSSYLLLSVSSEACFKRTCVFLKFAWFLYLRLSLFKSVVNRWQSSSKSKANNVLELWTAGLCSHTFLPFEELVIKCVMCRKDLSSLELPGIPLNPVLCVGDFVLDCVWAFPPTLEQTHCTPYFFAQ